MAIGWQLKGDGRTLGPDEVVAPHERLSWGRTIGLGMQHVVAMFGATFVFPVLMGLNPQLAIMMSGVATICFLLIVQGKIPSYLGSSASFVGAVVAIGAQGGTPQQVTGALLVAGVALALVGVFIHLAGAAALTKVLPPVVTGAVVMLIGFNLAPVVADTYWPQDQWIALIVMIAVVAMSVGLRGFFGRISVFLGLVLGYALSFLADRMFGQITSFSPAAGKITTHDRVDWSAVRDAPWLGFPPATDNAAGIVGWHLPEFKLAFVLVVLPAVIALVAENVGHVKAVAEMTGENLDPYMGRALMTPGGVLGGITVVLYGMIGLLGAKIWAENRVDFSNPLNLVPVAAGIIIAIGNTSMVITPDFVLSGIALGTIVTVVAYHLARALAPAHLRERADGAGIVLTHPGSDDLGELGLEDDFGRARSPLDER